jgi:1,4-alpha-glucan branching enzyme
MESLNVRRRVMFAKGSSKGTVRFVVKPNNGAKSAQLAGEFNNWRPATMRRQKDGSFVAEVPLKAGAYQYKFVLDGQWLADPDNSQRVPNAYGTDNSVAHVSD